MRGFKAPVGRYLKGGGWKKTSTNGGHEYWESEDHPGVKITVPVKILSRHTANSIMKQAGISEKL